LCPDQLWCPLILLSNGSPQSGVSQWPLQSHKGLETEETHRIRG